ncbi:paramyosin isoform X1 [Spodoptera frugiperda]|uniref:Paramyosin isoform X1 n=2 Tax=Spodoptera frugiperda TaxID=7108 RepID=A0A9R0D2C2_SPOFR|nr:paramyosin isoform X1 [Spodoptera frugiperda]
MKATKLYPKQRTARPEHSPRSAVDQTFSSPELPGDRNKFRSKSRVEAFGKTTFDVQSASESQLLNRENEPASNSSRLEHIPGKGDQNVSPVASDIMDRISPVQETSRKCTRMCAHRDPSDTVRGPCKPERGKCCSRQTAPRKTRACSPSLLDSDEAVSRQIRDIHNDTRKSARIIRDSRARLLEIQKKCTITEADVKELGERNELLLREMERFDRMTRNIQKLVGNDIQLRRTKTEPQRCMDYVPGSVYEPPLHHEMKMSHPTVLLAAPRAMAGPALGPCETQTRSKSEIDLTRKLSESYDMQEKLAADNADLEVKRYILYKELMTKDQNLETCRAQVKRLQGELKLMSRENSLLHEKLVKNNPEGDASTLNQNTSCQQDSSEENEKSVDATHAEELLIKLEDYKNSSEGLEKQLGGLEQEVHHIKMEMQQVKACRGGGGAPNSCFDQPPGPPVPPMARACGVCPPCPAPCNPNAPPTPAEREVEKLKIQLRQTEESFKTKVTECALLRAELLKKKEELEKERCQHREVQNKMRELEMKFEGLATHTNMLLGTKEQAFEQEVNVRALKQCYREAREEIDELRTLMKEQNDQLQDYRVKYMQAQQLVEEQRRQMDMMDMDNTRISEQINLEIQKVKLKFQEKLQELAPIPDLLKATQMRLKDAQQAQALAEHNAEQLARELNCAREKVHILLHNSIKPPPERSQDKAADDKQMAMMQQRLAQITETNMALKGEIERLKANVIHMEESVLANEKRLQEKMHECAQIGGELDRARDEAARALQRANERTETIRKCMQTTIAEMERQLAATRAQVKTAEKDREELQSRMQCQIRRLNDNFEQAQLRILGLQSQVQTLRRTVSSTGEGDGEDQQECACDDVFENRVIFMEHVDPYYQTKAHTQKGRLKNVTKE